MRLSVEILDHIFSFLVSHRETLIACSNDPVLSPILERHLYYHVIVRVSDGRTADSSNHTLEPEQLAILVSENPRILNYVRILQIQMEFGIQMLTREDQVRVSKTLDEFAETLILFPQLESIKVIGSLFFSWPWAASNFGVALEGRLKLPSVKEVHFSDIGDLPFSILDSCKHLKHLTFSSLFPPSFFGQIAVSTLPQLQSLRLITYALQPSLLAWLKLHINELQSLKCMPSYEESVLELLKECSDTLNKLDINFDRSQYCSKHTFRTGEINAVPLPETSFLSFNLQYLTIRTAVAFDYTEDGLPFRCTSWLPATSTAINLFVSSLQHLVVSIDINLSTFSELVTIDFSLLAILGSASLSIPRIDLYVHTGILPASLTRAQLVSSLEEYEDVMRSIEEGVLIIHSEKVAPDIEM